MASMVDSLPRSIWDTLPGVTHGLDKPSLGETALLALLGEPLPSLPGRQGLAAPLGFFGGR